MTLLVTKGSLFFCSGKPRFLRPTSAIVARFCLGGGLLRRRLLSSFVALHHDLTTSVDNNRRRHYQTNNTKDDDDECVVSILNQHDDDNILNEIPLQDVRNFCFIAHVDHGKSSLASRVLELAGNLGAPAQKVALQAAAAAVDVNQHEETNATKHETLRNQQQQHEPTIQQQQQAKENIELLDTLSVEKQRGITVKASAATMLYKHPSAVGPHGVLLLNMVDTPGHVDFGTEVSRSLNFVQGTVLLLDASQGIQAQTWNVHEKVRAIQQRQTESNLPELNLLVALTKVDLPLAQPIHVALTVSEWLSWDDPDDILWTSARNRVGITHVLDAVCRQVPPPLPIISEEEDHENNRLWAQVVDSWFDPLRGVECLIQIKSGTIQEGDRIVIVDKRQTHRESDRVTTADTTMQSSSSYSVQEVGLLLPHLFRTKKLSLGQMGYVRFGLRDPRQALPGTILTIFQQKQLDDIPPELLFVTPDSKETTRTSVLYASVHPIEADGFEELCHAVDKLALNDTGLEVSKKASFGSDHGSTGGPFLGPGLRVGFQGLLHVEVFRQRLLDEFNLDAVVTPPKVPYTVTVHPSKRNQNQKQETFVVENLSDWPKAGTRFTVKEPVVRVRIVSPMDYAGSVMDLVKRKRGHDLSSTPLDEDTWVFSAVMPWGEVVTNFHNDLKNVTAGYGSLDTWEADPPLEEADLTKIDIMLNGEIVEPLSFVCHRSVAQSEGRVVCSKLKEVLPRQQFVTVIQAASTDKGRIIASERIQAYRKDVLVTGGSKSVGGGDVTRKKKLLEKQKRGKKRQQTTGKVSLSQAAFNSVITRSS